MNEGMKAVELTDAQLKQVNGGTGDPNEKPSCYRPSLIGRQFEPKHTCNGCIWIDECMH